MTSGTAFSLNDHISLVTGGNGGIGLGMAEALAAAGATVVICGTNSEKNAIALKRLQGLHPGAQALVCDVGDEDAVDAMITGVIEAHGRIDSCFINAGVGGAAPSFVEMTTEEWRRVMRVNLDGAFYTARAMCRHFTHRFSEGDTSGGSLIFTSSGSAYFGQQRGQHYGASKAGLISMMRAIAVEHARHNVRSNAVMPGWIESEMTAPALGWQAFIDKVLPRVPMRRWGQPTDFGGIAVYLASGLSSYHTGDVITIDGGYHSF